MPAPHTHYRRSISQLIFTLSMPIVIGIDLGTTRCCVGALQHGQVRIVANDVENRTTPSYVMFTPEELLVGDIAKNQQSLDPKNTVYEIKRLMGARPDDEWLRQARNHWPFQITEDDGRLKVQVQYKGETRLFAPEEITSMILKHLKSVAEAFFGEPVTDAVITVPAYFNDAQRRATKEAGRIAGLNVLRILNEPVAAAISYGLEEKILRDCHVLVYDLGGGTFDVSVLKISDKIFELKSINGDTHLGGADFDNRLVRHVIKLFEEQHGVDLSLDMDAVQRIRNACEEVKRILSSRTQATLELDQLYEGIDFNINISRSLFESLNKELFDLTLEIVSKALSDAHLNKDQIDAIVLVGGSSRIPKIQRMLRDYFNGKRLTKSVNPDEVVCRGAALYAAKLTGARNEMTGEITLQNVVPFSLGSMDNAKRMVVLIHRNTPIPASASLTVTTTQNYQRLISFTVWEGEDRQADKNRFLGEFNIPVQPAPRGRATVILSFEVDFEGILTVKAVDTATHAQMHMTINHSAIRPGGDQWNVSNARATGQNCLISKEYLEDYAYTLLRSGEASSLEPDCLSVIEWIDNHPNCNVNQIQQKYEKLARLAGDLSRPSDS
ncbi:unnamed protein product [Calicophoron daubneyi]|uniref:Uncharacterized protein n=1 Tax=Calicophoron daubneyi TaxID=300641 RepID=A0AAV2T6L2_CALDB